PAISDPGARLVAASLEAGLEVTVLPGPSAVETGLVASGLVGEEGYQFVGYLPRGEGALLALGEELVRRPWAVVAFESPQRLPASLGVLARAIPDRPAAVSELLDAGVPRRQAADVVARLTGVARNRLYRASL